MFDEALLLDHVRRAEARNGVHEQFVYNDSVGIPTIGYGRNLQDVGINREEAELLLKNDIASAKRDAEKLDYFSDLNPARQMVVVDMVFNLGLPRFLRFKLFNAALALKDYPKAAYEMEDSRWYNQVGSRAKKLQKIMLTGLWDG